MSDTKRKITGIIAAGGSGQRLGAAGGKQLLFVAGKPIVAWAIDALAAARLIDDIVVVCDPDRVEEYVQTISISITTEKPVAFVAGGDTREDSVVAGLDAVTDADIVAIHDGARPLLDPDSVDAGIQMLIDGVHLDGVVLGNRVVDTLKRVDADEIIDDTPDRSCYWQAQTPQIFWQELIVDAYAFAKKNGFQGTDDASYLEWHGAEISMLASSRNNIKVTTAEDVDFVELFLAERN